jgi:hypothetical protein
MGNNGAPAQRGRVARSLLVAGAVENIIRCALCLGGGMNQKPAIVEKFLQPASDIGGLIRENSI